MWWVLQRTCSPVQTCVPVVMTGGQDRSTPVPDWIVQQLSWTWTDLGWTRCSQVQLGAALAYGRSTGVQLSDQNAVSVAWKAQEQR